MPLYDWECAHGHRFEKVVPIEHRNEPIPCEGDLGAPPIAVDGNTSVRRGPPCPLLASRVEICHARPAAMLDYGLARNRDAAREGRYDPARPSTRGVRKVQI